MRDIKWLFSHAGGTIPMLAGRIESFFDRAGNRDRFAPDGIEAEFRRLITTPRMPRIRPRWQH
jgi:hypothetical protein